MSAPTGFKRLGVVLGALAGAILIVLAVASYLITAESASAAVQAEIKAATGFEPTVRGPVSLSVFPSPRVLLGDVAMAGPDGRDPPLTVERMVVHLRWLPLLVGRFDIADVALDHPHITVKIDRQGRFNWSPQIEALARTVRAGERTDAQTLSFSEIRIANGVIAVEDGVRDTTERLEKVELSLAWPSIAKGFAATGRVAWRDESLDMGLTIADFTAALSGDVSGLKLRVAGPAGKLAFDGSISYLPSLKIDGTLVVDAPSLRNALHWASGKPLPGGGLGRLSSRRGRTWWAG